MFRRTQTTYININGGIDDHEIFKASTHIRLPWIYRLYTWPFLIIYSVWMLGYISLPHDEPYELWLFSLGVTITIHVLSILSCHWSVRISVLLTCYNVSYINKKVVIAVIPHHDGGKAGLVSLLHDNNDDSSTLYFMFHERKFIYNERENMFTTLSFPIEKRMVHYREWRGLDATPLTSTSTSISTSGKEEHVISSKTQECSYGSNSFAIPSPRFIDLLQEQAMAPFFVFQTFCVSLWMLDENWYYGLFILFMLIVFECTVVKQRLKHLSTLHSMATKPYPLNVFRGGRWNILQSSELLPGDLVSLKRGSDIKNSSTTATVPCDVLLLRGSCIANEAMLTGEAVPQPKEPLIGSEEQDMDTLDIQSNKLHVIFGGTTIIQHSGSSGGGRMGRCPDGGCLCYVLRTGFNTSQGSLVRTILFSTERMTAGSAEAFAFISILLVFAIVAALYVWIEASADPDRNKYKLLLECTLIITSVVPPELPMELTFAVNTSILALVRLSIFCTEPFRIPLAGKVDMCCFDKTGTLTSDQLIVEGVASIGTEECDDNINDSVLELSSNELNPLAAAVLASCHSLVHVANEGIIGDPMELSTLNALRWRFSHNGEASPPKNFNAFSLRIIRRFHFSSSLKRMAVVSSQGNGRYFVAVKGAPEIVKTLLEDVPTGYDKTYNHLARRGFRVLSLAWRVLPDSTSEGNVAVLERDDVESGLSFAGFLVVRCPLKSDSRKALSILRHSSHSLCMITGDNANTACHVAGEVKITSRHTLILRPQRVTKADNCATSVEEWTWCSMDDAQTPVTNDDTIAARDYDLCVTGDGLNYLMSGNRYYDLVKLIKVYARVTPKQKEEILKTMNRSGLSTLMCGDGTNDVGALKQAHIGVALLNAPGSAEASAVKSRKKFRLKQRTLEDVLEASDDGTVPVPKLGDASVASPFTSKFSSVLCACKIIRQGRCTLVTTHQMFQILALNCLISAYSLSVLFLDGIKFGDSQATYQGIMLAIMFLFISHSKSVEKMSSQRPHSSIFNLYMFCSILGQFAVHITLLILIVRASKSAHISYSSEPDVLSDGVDFLEAEFEASIVNTTVYIMSVWLQIGTFAVNYRGRPFMYNLTESKPLLISIFACMALIIALVLGVSDDLSSTFEVVHLPEEFRVLLLQVLATDLFITFFWDRICRYFLLPKSGYMSSKSKRKTD